jgi:hypothetical protein
MSAGEIVWRVKSSAFAVWQSFAISRGHVPSNGVGISSAAMAKDIECNRISRGTNAGIEGSVDLPQSELSKLLETADRISRHELELFNLGWIDLGSPIDWQRDHSAQKSSTLRLIQNVDYRDFETVGDCKLVWEPNRHHQLVVLARAYRASGDDRYAQAMLRILESWMDANPFGRGMNWRSPLELAIRLINWSWALSLAQYANTPPPLLERIGCSVYDHCREIRQKYSQGSSANNHLIGEAAGVFVACSLFQSIPNARECRREAASILEHEIQHQTFQCGCNCEHAFGYHLFVSQFFLVCKLAADAIGESFGSAFDTKLGRMIDFTLAMMEASASMPSLGDCDDGYVLDLGDDISSYDLWLMIGALLYNREDCAWKLRAVPQSTGWLFGRAAVSELEAIRTATHVGETYLASRSFPESGYYLLQDGARESGISLLVDCAELGYGPIAAHGHADALSLCLRVGGEEILTDPGTYDYFSHADWRNYFRSTKAHNTICIDETDQSEMLGPFLWGQRAQCRVHDWTDDAECVRLLAEHDGYTRLSSSVIHRREVILRKPERQIEIVDTLLGEGSHVVELNFHVAPGLSCRTERENLFNIDARNSRVTIEIDTALRARLVVAGKLDKQGWISRGYHRLEPGHAIVAQASLQLPITLATRIIAA